MTIALIDADLVIYMACAGERRVVDWGDGEIEEWVDPDEAYRHAKMLAEQWRQKAGARELVFCLSSEYNFRKWLYPVYKSNRKTDPPTTLKEVRARIETNEKTLEIPGLEADDVMGIYGTKDPKTYVIVSRDKDMQTVPARFLNPDKGRRPVKIAPSMADRHFMRQTMQGDSVDGFSGIPNIGPAKAQAIITNPTRLVRKERTISRGKNKGQQKVWYEEGDLCGLWQAMVDRAEAAGMTEDDLITQARMARILRHQDYDADNGHIRLWHPRQSEWVELGVIIDDQVFEEQTEAQGGDDGTTV